jgi:hypothetical protein
MSAEGPRSIARRVPGRSFGLRPYSWPSGSEARWIVPATPFAGDSLHHARHLIAARRRSLARADAEAHTVNGSVRARLGSTGVRESLDFSTVNGSIRLRKARGI